MKRITIVILCSLCTAVAAACAQKTAPSDRADRDSGRKPPAGSPGDRIGIGERTLVLWISDGMRTAPGVQHVPQVAFPANFHSFFRDSAEVGGESVPSCTRKET